MIGNLKKVFFGSKIDTGLVYQDLVDSFIKDPEFPWLISYPRTGSHWLRMMMELYFEKPSLVRAFYFKNAKDFTCYHQHDDDLKIEGVRKVIYIFRNPVDTVFSNLQYYKENIEDEQKIVFRTHQYSNHLAKWLLQENFTNKKLVLTYEGLKYKLRDEFKKIVEFFNMEFDVQRFEEVAKKVSKMDLKKRTSHDSQVVNLEVNYNSFRKEFRNEFRDKIIFDLFSKNPALSSLKDFQSILKDENN